MLRPVVAACIMLLPATAAYAQPPARLAVRLEYNRGAGMWGCPHESTLRHLLASHLGYDPITADAKDLLAVSVSRKGRTFHAELSAANASGQVFWNGAAQSDKDCTDLLTSAALVIRIGIGPFRASPRTSPPALPAAADAAPPSKQRPPACPPLLPAPVISPCPPAPPPASSLRYLFGVSGFLALNRAPSPAPGFSISAAARWSSISIVFDGKALIPLALEIRGAHGQIGEVRPSLIATNLGACGHVGFLFVCPMLELGMRQFGGSPNVRVEVENPFSAGFVLRGGAEWFFWKHLALVGSLELNGMLTQTVLTVEKEEVWRSPVFGGAFSLGIFSSF